MAWSKVQNLGSNTGGNVSTLDITLSATHTAGNQIVVNVCWIASLTSISSITDSGGNTYTLVYNRQMGNKCASNWVTDGAIAAGATITVHFSSTSTNCMACAVEFNGGLATRDGFNNAIGTTGNPTVSITVANANSIALGVVAQIASAAGDLTEDANFATDYDFKHPSTNLVLHAAHAFNPSLGSFAYTPVSANGSISWTEVLGNVLASPVPFFQHVEMLTIGAG